MQFPKIKSAIRREMDGQCALCGEDIESKPAGPHNLAHLECVNLWFAEKQREWAEAESDGT